MIYLFIYFDFDVDLVCCFVYSVSRSSGWVFDTYIVGARVLFFRCVHIWNAFFIPFGDPFIFIDFEQVL